ncbi:hypothetical protein SteCoe_38751 [Stentor coeruleus]|uniref:ubiquitinyl hydrolase 1 n=1 Tax=Stentor coeruleus TaxID=5963 RepID=A0A1R2ALC3_9CILI|nr:hypothetical protein SteCoe_38751 [Stentor coeruleus]
MSNRNQSLYPHNSPNAYSNAKPSSPFASPNMLKCNQVNSEFEIQSSNSAVCLNPLQNQSPSKIQDKNINKMWGPLNFKKINIGIDDEEYPKTISKFWIKIDNMKKMYPFNIKFTSNVDKLKKEMCIAAWKRSRGDGNCYFRAVITSYYDIIHKPYSPIEDLESFKEILSRLCYYDIIHKPYSPIEDLESFKEILSRLYLDYPGIEEFFDARDEILKSIDKSIYIKQNDSKITAYENALNNLQNEKFDINLVKVSRFITACAFMEAKDSSDISSYLVDGYESFLHEMMEMGKEGGEFTLILLPTKLKIQVIQYMYLDKEIIVQSFPNQVEKDSKVISIIRRAGHYDILYQKKSLELDGCDLRKGTFNFTEDLNYYKELEQSYN